MNERIQELSEQALEIVSNKRMLKDGQLERTWDPHEYDQVFAELIVRECIDWCNAHATVDGTTTKIVESIREHFGVKE